MNFITTQWFAFWYSIAFLTRIPAPNLSQALKSNNKNISKNSIYYYPLVGLIIGAVLVTCYFAFQLSSDGMKEITTASAMLIAAIVLTLWSLLTGGLHLDGLADAADAWVGGYGDKQRTLEIMKDPTVGPMGVMLVVLVLLIKFSALTLLMVNQQWWLLLAVPMLARFFVLPLFYFTPYVREKGLGSSFSKTINSKVLIVLTTLVALISTLLFQQKTLLVLGVALALFVWARNLMIQRIEGTTGDTAGAMIEVLEVFVLAAAVI